jgi:hypothetical protein
MPANITALLGNEAESLLLYTAIQDVYLDRR